MYKPAKLDPAGELVIQMLGSYAIQEWVVQVLLQAYA